ncbi:MULTISPECIES: hypothetical protein [unclassified Sphingomonas]|nr:MULTISPECIES: hypothetical protein [unclassified Sphingomonas]
MSRLVLTIAVLAVIVIGGMVLLAGRTTERPQTHVEKAVALANLQ